MPGRIADALIRSGLLGDIGRQTAGLVDEVATVGSAMGRSSLAGVNGLLRLAATGDPDAAAARVEEVENDPAFTYQPRTQEARENLAQLGGLIGRASTAVANTKAGNYVNEKLYEGSAQNPLLYAVAGAAANAAGGPESRVAKAVEREALLNIGHKVGNVIELTPERIEAALKKRGVSVKAHQVKQSGTEPTSVVQLDRPLSDTEAHELSAELGQDAIAQKVGDAGALHGPRASEWGDFNNEFFLPLDQAAPKPKRVRGPKQTVANPKRLNNPAIYEDPRAQVAKAEAMVEPEDPLLHQLFGVHREDLADMWMARTDEMNARDVFGGLGKNPKGSKEAADVMTPANERRIGNLLDVAKESKILAPGMIGWYESQPLWEKFLKAFDGDKVRAAREYDLFDAATATHSFMSPVEGEITRGTLANKMRAAGNYEHYKVHGGKPQKTKPEDLAVAPGHVAHKAQAQAFENFFERGLLPNSSKAPAYFYASRPAELGGQTNLAIGDTHWSEFVGLNDVRSHVNGNASPTEMWTLAPWYAKVARKSGLNPVAGQALQWGAGAPATGVKTGIGAPKLEIIAKRVGLLAKRENISPEEALNRVIRAQAEAGHADPRLLAAVGGGGLLAAYLTSRNNRTGRGAE